MEIKIQSIAMDENKSITVDQAKDRRYQMEQAIEKTIDSFNEYTGTRVTEIQILYNYCSLAKCDRAIVNIEVKL